MSDMLKASVEKLKNDYLRGEYELDEFIEILTKQSKQDEVNDNPHLGYKTALVPDELLKPQPQEKVDLADEKIKEYINSQPYYGHCTEEWLEGIEQGAKWMRELAVNTTQDNGLRKAAEKVVKMYEEAKVKAKGGTYTKLAKAINELEKALNQNK